MSALERGTGSENVPVDGILLYFGVFFSFFLTTYLPDLRSHVTVNKECIPLTSQPGEEACLRLDGVEFWGGSGGKPPSRRRQHAAHHRHPPALDLDLRYEEVTSS